MTKLNYTLDQLEGVASQILDASNTSILLFYGPMGSGKTTLIKELCKQLGVKDVTSSPTFSLVNEYQGKNGQLIYHFDFYRIDDESEAFDMGVEEYFDSGALCLVEWPEKVENLLPLESTVIRLEIQSNKSRTLQIS